MKSIKIDAFNVEQAKNLAIESNLFTGVQIDATMSWKKAGEPDFGTPAFNEFAAEYTTKKLKSMPGIGAIVTIDKGQMNTRKRPYSIENIANTTTRKMETVYSLYVVNEDGTHTELTRIKGIKADAMDYVRDYYKNGGMAETVFCEVIRRVKPSTEEENFGEPLTFVAHYAPSASENLGTYVVFGEIA